MDIADISCRQKEEQKGTELCLLPKHFILFTVTNNYTCMEGKQRKSNPNEAQTIINL